MTRSFHHLACAGETLAVTLDSASGATVLLIVSGGNEIRSGAHAGMAGLAARIADHGYPVLRYDRRGIGESTGRNDGFLASAADIAAAAAFLRREQQARKIVAFGNCDAATGLALFGPNAGIDGYILANPWVIETESARETQEPTLSSAAIRARYWDRIRNPRSVLDLLSGKIDIGKLLKGIRQAARSEDNGALSLQLRDALSALENRADILLAKRDTTARAFLAAWNSADYVSVRNKATIKVEWLDSASHSFADIDARNWLTDKILEALRSA